MAIKVGEPVLTLNPEKIPNHVAVIMDGNGRWAERKMMPRVFGHRKGADRVREIVESAGDIGVKVLTLFAFSEENWQRPKAEIDSIMRLLNIYLKKERDELRENNVRLEVVGNVERLPYANQMVLRETVEHLSKNTGLRLVLALSYGARSDILTAVKSLVRDVENGVLKNKDICETQLRSRLLSSDLPDVDLLIRTSGELRVSNFLLWQIAYAEMYFANVHWPDFSKNEFLEAINNFQKRKRRFGRVEELNVGVFKENSTATL